MAAGKLRLTSFKLLKSYNICNVFTAGHKLFYCTTKTESEESSADKKLGFAKFSEKKSDFLKEPEPKVETFASLLRNSQFVNLGDPVGKVVIGEIFTVVEEDLYIDFGWKFPTVCRRPQQNKELYVPGAKVKLRINELELSTKFLGGDGYITLLEADCILLGLLGASRRRLTTKPIRRSTATTDTELQENVVSEKEEKPATPTDTNT